MHQAAGDGGNIVTLVTHLVQPLFDFALQAVLRIELVGMGTFRLLRNFDQAFGDQQLPLPGE